MGKQVKLGMVIWSNNKEPGDVMLTNDLYRFGKSVTCIHPVPMRRHPHPQEQLAALEKQVTDLNATSHY